MKAYWYVNIENFQVNITSTATMGTVTGLSPFTEYSCTIHAVSVADGPVSDPAVVTTTEAGKGSS